ncbi:HTH-type transcriptional repressor PurR [bioreactor metagenome]|uniref:HTH-type transcriptional repressor PurR n=1 Tax=bioreactor metagenome TaxID=1076179 RepID=A0A645HCX0_9ZZZZ
MISIHDYKENSSVPAVTANLKTPIDELFDRILAQGRRAISIFEVKDRHSEAIVPEGINAKKLSLLKEAIHKNNLQNIPDFVKLLSTSPADGYGLIMEMHQSNRMPDTIILTRDSLAIGVLRAIHELGLKIPDDVAIISFDNLAFSPFLTPSLSSVDLNRQLMGELAFRTLVEHIDCGTPLTSRSVEAKLILRESFSS